MLTNDVLHISGTNAAVEKVNSQRLDEIDGLAVELTASVYSETRGNFLPSLDNKGDIRGTTLPYKVRLKKGCKVMLTYNIDVTDGLTNGSQGTLVDIITNKDGKIKYFLIKFDVESSGQKRRKNNDVILNEE